MLFRSLKTYAKQLKIQKPDLAPLIDEIAKDATKEGPLYKSLVSRLDYVKSKPEAFPAVAERLDEVKTVRQAASTSLFNDALSDSVNVLADMSDGKLPRVKAMSKQAEQKSNRSKDYGAGSQYIGNPSYGHWQQNSSGTSFWAWYGMYSMFNNLSRPVYYGNWSSNRGYSYYNDYGRSRYTSPTQRTSQQATYNRTKKSFASKGKSFSSPYSKTKTGSSSLSLASKTPSKSSSYSSGRSSYSSGKSSSSYASSSSRSNSSYSSSSRSGYSRSSRSYSGGK